MPEPFLLKNWLWHTCFPVSFTKLLWTLFYRARLGDKLSYLLEAKLQPHCPCKTTNIWTVSITGDVLWKKLFWEKKHPQIEFLIGSFCTPHSICLNIGFWQRSFLWKCCFFNFSTFNLKTIVVCVFSKKMFQS